MVCHLAVGAGRDPARRRASAHPVLLSYAAFWKSIIFDFFLVRGLPLPPRQWRETLIGPATFGIVWLYAGYALIARRVLRGVRPFRV